MLALTFQLYIVPVGKVENVVTNFSSDRVCFAIPINECDGNPTIHAAACQ